MRYAPLYQRVLERVGEPDENGCWPWIGRRTPSGYGILSVEQLGRNLCVYGHRYLYELYRAPIPAGLQVDHLCRNAWCVNPAHLEPVTLEENARRASLHHYNGKKTHCPHGHPYDDENTYRTPSGYRVCRRCRAKYETKRKRSVA